VTGWELTAKTIYCDAVDDDVTVMVYKDRSTKEAAQVLKKKAKRLGRNLKCEGPNDHRVTDYRDRLMAEDKAPPAPTKLTKKKRARH
jgi:hypothetical protein